MFCFNIVREVAGSVKLVVHVDSKSIVDNLSVTAPKVSERRLLRDLAAIRQTIVENAIEVRHVRGGDNPADVLTKMQKFSGAMAGLLKSNRYMEGQYDLTNVFLAEYSSDLEFVETLREISTFCGEI